MREDLFRLIHARRLLLRDRDVLVRQAQILRAAAQATLEANQQTMLRARALLAGRQRDRPGRRQKKNVVPLAD